MEGHEPDTRYLTLWICVIISAVIIFTGWIFVMKYNFTKINEEMVNQDVTVEKATQEMGEMFDGVKKIMEEQGSLLEEVLEKEAAKEKELEVSGDKKTKEDEVITETE